MADIRSPAGLDTAQRQRDLEAGMSPAGSWREVPQRIAGLNKPGLQKVLEGVQSQRPWQMGIVPRQIPVPAAGSSMRCSPVHEPAPGSLVES